MGCLRVVINLGELFWTEKILYRVPLFAGKVIPETGEIDNSFMECLEIWESLVCGVASQSIGGLDMLEQNKISDARNNSTSDVGLFTEMIGKGLQAIQALLLYCLPSGLI